MIHLIGASDTREYAAASALRDVLVAGWPQVADSRADTVWIVAGAKCHGQATRDIDILMLANFSSQTFAPFLPFQTRDGQYHKPDSVVVQSLCVILEVKDHDPQGVRFIGTAVEVIYHGKWHNASEQNEKQLYAVKRYLEGHGFKPPRITALVWLRNVPNYALPTRPHTIVGSTLTWDLLLTVIAQITPPHYKDGQWYLSAVTQDQAVLARMADLFSKVVVPTRLDRQRVERITQQSVTISTMQQALGSKLTILRGRGGTGKTVHLLQLANRLSEDEDARVLILTYNRALVADIRRVLTIMGVSDDITYRSIHIQTVHSFIHSALRGLEILADDTSRFLEDYDAIKDQALEYLKSGAVVSDDIETLISSDAETFRWDYVFVDEGQDWPRNERELLLHLYPYTKVVVADGVDQLVRSTTAADWKSGLTPAQRQVIPLKTCLRMKAGLARFVSAVARHLGLLNMEWEANTDIPGGHVIVVDGPYLLNRSLHDRLLRTNADDGNAPVDMLFCIPPNLIDRSVEPHASVVSSIFQEWGFHVWDGAVDVVRDTYPTELNQLRIVQYESCRGLEGWTVVNLGLDSLYEYKRLTVLRPTPLAMPGQFADDDTIAHLYAARWLFIPLTRAIDTLVIQLDHDYSPIRAALQAAAMECEDFVEWLSVK